MCDGPEASVNQEKISEGNEEVPIETHFLMKLKVSENESVHAPDASALHQPGAGVMRTEMPFVANVEVSSELQYLCAGAHDAMIASHDDCTIDTTSDSPVNLCLNFQFCLRCCFLLEFFQVKNVCSPG